MPSGETEKRQYNKTIFCVTSLVSCLRARLNWKIQQRALLVWHSAAVWVVLESTIIMHDIIQSTRSSDYFYRVMGKEKKRWYMRKWRGGWHNIWCTYAHHVDWCMLDWFPICRMGVIWLVVVFHDYCFMMWCCCACRERSLLCGLLSLLTALLLVKVVDEAIAATLLNGGDGDWIMTAVCCVLLCCVCVLFGRMKVVLPPAFSLF